MALQQPAAGANPAEQHRDRDQRQRVLAGEKGDEDAGVAIASDQIGAGALLHGRDLDHAGKASRSAAKKAGQHDQPADRQANHARRPQIAPGDPRGKADRGVADQHVGADADDDADRQAPMDLGTGHCADHVGIADRRRGRLVEAARIAERPLDELVQNGDRDVVQQQAGNRLVDAAPVAQCPDQCDPQAAGDDPRRGHRQQRRNRRRAVQRDAGHRRKQAADHKGALAADDHQPGLRR